MTRDDEDLKFQLLAEIIWQNQRGVRSELKILRALRRSEKFNAHQFHTAAQHLSDEGLISVSPAPGSAQVCIDGTEFGKSVFSKALARGGQPVAVITGKWFPTDRKARDPNECSDLVYHVILDLQTASALVDSPGGPAQDPEAHNRSEKPREGILYWTLDELNRAGRILRDGSAGFLRTANGQVYKLTEPRSDFHRDSESERVRVCITTDSSISSGS